MFKKCPVVMLPTNEEAQIQKFGRRLRLYRFLKNNLAYWENLYFLSDEEIKEGDWYVNNGVIFRADDKFDEGNNPNQNKHNKKIIATTDKLIIGDDKGKSLLGTDLNNYLPQPSQSFIEKFVEEYNKGNIITEVMVEYEWNKTGKKVREVEIFDDVLKVNAKDNTITTRKVKDSWNRDELITLLNKFGSKVYGEYTRNETMEDFTDKWIEENL